MHHGVQAMKKILSIIWQRLVTSDGKTCERCGQTYLEMLKAVEILQERLAPVGITPVLRTTMLSESEFKANPAESNRIWIADKPIEEWLEASVGSSPCCDACGEENCRTLAIGNSVYERIPQSLIIEAGMRAAQSL